MQKVLKYSAAFCQRHAGVDLSVQVAHQLDGQQEEIIEYNIYLLMTPWSSLSVLVSVLCFRYYPRGRRRLWLELLGDACSLAQLFWVVVFALRSFLCSLHISLSVFTALVVEVLGALCVEYGV